MLRPKHNRARLISSGEYVWEGSVFDVAGVGKLLRMLAAVRERKVMKPESARTRHMMRDRNVLA
jgi:hypothetical protein